MKIYKPTTPGRRGMTGINWREVLTARHPHKPLTSGFQRAVGRNNYGRITVRHKGGGAKRLWREVDFRYNKKNIAARVESVEYDPNRTALIGLALYADGERRYVLLPKNSRVGDTFIVGETVPLKLGNRLPLNSVPVGTFVYNVELKPGGGAKLGRSAGTFVQVVANEGGYAHLKLSSGEIRKVSSTCYASIGQVGNEEHHLINIGKAGRSRHMGIRPTVRGSAMNPVDHPYGGGEGRQGRGTRRPKTMWGKVTGGRKTRRPKKYSNTFILSRRFT